MFYNNLTRLHHICPNRRCVTECVQLNARHARPAPLVPGCSERPSSIVASWACW
jgi:hypothetical protein